MATYSGSGKYIAFQAGQLNFGVDNQQYGYFQATTKNYDSVIYYGLTSSIQYINLLNVTELACAKGVGYTGTIKMYSYYYSPYNTLIWDSEDYSASSIRSTAVTYRFVNGIMVGTA